MSRDMKPRKQRNASPKRKSRGNTLVGLFVGLVVGILVAAGVVWYLQKAPTPFTNKSPPPPSQGVAPAQASIPAQGTSGTNQAGAGTSATPGPLALPGKPGDPIPQSDKPRFDFYKILPGNAEAVPATKQSDSKQAETKTKSENEKETSLKEPIFLQTGSFQNAGDADNQKAKLAMMGAEASVQQVMLQDKVWYRVRLGPFKKMDEVSNMRSDLAKQGIDANVVKKD